MPNVFNFLHIQAPESVYKAIFETIAAKEAGIGSIDFSNITPMPAWVTSLAQDDITREWCQQAWGSDTNAIDPKASADVYDGGSGIYFITHASDVRDLMSSLSRMYPSCYIDYMWAHQDIDKGAGAMQFCSGQTTVTWVPIPGSRQAYELAFDILHAKPADYGMVFDPAIGNYVWKGGERHGCRTDR